MLCDWIEANLVHGPGDLRGQPIELDDEKRALVYRLYEIWPEGTPRAGRRRFLRACVSLRKGLAKALALDTPVPTPRGWTTMGEIQVGDLVFDETGAPRRVVATSPVFVGSQCFEVRFRDGSSIVADADHRWFTQELRHRPYVGSVKTTADIAATISVRADGALNHRIPVAAPLQLPKVDLPIDPWVLGAWLGDGRTDDAEFSLHESDLDHFESRVRAAGYFCGKVKPDRRSCALAVRVSTALVIKGGITRRDSLKGRLRAVGLLGNKHVPASYLRASAEQRLALLQGLMDTDGSISADGATCIYTSTLRALADGVFELIASLGMKPALHPQQTVCVRGASRVTGAPSWRITFHASRATPVFTLERKLVRQRPAPPVTPMSTNRHIVSAVDVPSVPTRCIAVDSPSHLFLAGRAMIPTHNT
jgi:replicative DNA helicase